MDKSLHLHKTMECNYPFMLFNDGNTKQSSKKGYKFRSIQVKDCCCNPMIIMHRVAQQTEPHSGVFAYNILPFVAVSWPYYGDNGVKMRQFYQRYFHQIRNSMKLCNALLNNVITCSQPNVVYITAVTLSRRVQSFVLISWSRFKAHHSKF